MHLQAKTIYLDTNDGAVGSEGWEQWREASE